MAEGRAMPAWRRMIASADILTADPMEAGAPARFTIAAALKDCPRLQ
jgi:hypothetical protein